MCTLASRMVKLRRITATFFVTTGFYDRVLAEIKMSNGKLSDKYTCRNRKNDERLLTPCC